MRKSILACTVSFLMSPIASWALGMGDIQVNSSLNQPLNAEIKLHSVTKKDLDSLRIGLASRKIFSRANLERGEYLSKFKFKLVQRNGKNYVIITTRKAFREPFANFLVEATWGSGRLLREYTMLLDPPEFIKKHARPVATATASRSSQVKRKTTSSKPAKKASSSSAENYVLSPSGKGDLSYGPTQRNDTLWTIAKNMAPDNVSVDQMMMALLRDNPDAFVGNNINNLKAGYVLRIKDRDSLNKVSRSNANRQVKDQYQSWKETRQQKPAANLVDRSDRSVAETPADGQLKLIASGDTENADMQGDLSAQTKQLKEKLTLAGEDIDSKEVENQELRARIKELEELLQTKSSLVELKDASLAALQKQKEIQGLEVETPAETVVMVEEAPVETVVVEEPPVETVMVEEPPVETAMVEEPPVTMADDKSPQEVTSVELSEHIDPSVELMNDAQMLAESTIPQVNVDEVIAIPEIIQTKEEVKPVVEPTPKAVVKPKPKPKKVVEPEENIVDVLLSEEILPFTVGGGALFLGLLAWLGLRGRGKKENEFEESILDSKMQTADESDFGVDDSELVETESNTEVLASDTETSFLSDFSADDMESLQPDDTEADPISEADVFMVYGRYQQAEELLQEALKTEPERLDYQLKLLEVYHGDNLKDSFAVQADVVKDLLKKNSDDFELTSEWTKAKSWAEKLGVDIEMPDSFDEDDSMSSDSGITDAVAAADDDELSLDDLSDELSLDSEEMNLNEDSLLDNIEDSDLENIDDEFDLSLDEEINTDDEATSEFSLDDSELDSNDLDSSDLDSNEGTDEFELSLEDMDSDEEETILDLDESTMDLDDSLELEGEALSEDTLEFDGDLELEDDSLELESDGLELEDDGLELESESLDLGDDLELDYTQDSKSDTDTLELDDALELDDVDNSLATEGDELDLLDDDDLDFDELEDDFPELDAVGTKLDLAKAYIDMGDMESASSILNEVIDEGDDEQKSQAKSLLEQTDS